MDIFFIFIEDGRVMTQRQLYHLWVSQQINDCVTVTQGRTCRDTAHGVYVLSQRNFVFFRYNTIKGEVVVSIYICNSLNRVVIYITN